MGNLFDDDTFKSTPCVYGTWETERAQEAHKLRSYRGWFTYFMWNHSLNIVKIGRSHNVLRRQRVLEYIHHAKLKIIFVQQGDQEKEYHEQFRRYKQGREFYRLSKEIMEWIDYMEGTNRYDYVDHRGELVKARKGNYGEQYWSVYLENGNSEEDDNDL